MKPTTRRKVRRALTGYSFLSLNIVGFMVFTAIPVVASLVLAFFAYDNITAPKFVGVGNFTSLLGWHVDQTGRVVMNDPKFWNCLYNTVFMMLGLPLTMVGSLALALALNRKLPGTITLRTVYYLPTISPMIAVALVWLWILNPEYGLINYLISRLGVQGPNWLGDTAWAKPAFILIGTWGGIGGFTMLLYLAALQGIPGVYYEAAEIDGASPWKRFRYITWPLLGPVNFFIIVMGIIGGFQAFGMQYVMTSGGPAGSTTTIAYYIFNNAFSFFKMGYASAMAWVLFFMIFVLTILQWRFRRRYTFQYD